MLNGPQREVVKITPEEERLIKRLQTYREDFPRHAAECLKIVDKESHLRPLVMNRPQLLIHAKLEAQKAEHGMVRAIILKGRKQGASTYIGARFYSKVRLWKHRHAKVMAHVQDSTDALFDMVQNIYENDPLRLRTEAASAKQFKFSNHSSYTVATAGGSGEAGRGDTPTLGHMSEVAFYKNAEKNFAGFANSIPIAAGTEVLVESTANGVGNDFHQRWVRAEAGMEDHTSLGVTYIPIFIPWFMSDEYQLPPPYGFELRGEPEGDGLPSEKDLAEMYGLSISQMVWRRFQVEQALGSVETFMQEYPNNPSEAFQTPGLELFIKPVYVARARRRNDIKPYGVRVLGVDPAGLGGDKFAMSFREGLVLHWYKSRNDVEPGEEQADWVAHEMERNNIDRCNIDYSGGWGASLLSAMRMKYPKLADKCYAVDFGAKAQAKVVNPHKPGPRNRRAEMYTRARDWFMLPEGTSIPDDNELQSDLGAVTARISGQSTDTVLESKVEIKKRLGRSPDVADSFVLTFAVPDRAIQTTLTASKPSGNEEFDKGALAKPVLVEDAPVVIDRFGSGRTGFDSGGGWMA